MSPTEEQVAHCRIISPYLEERRSDIMEIEDLVLIVFTLMLLGAIKASADELNDEFREGQ